MPEINEMKRSGSTTRPKTSQKKKKVAKQQNP
jgi:hypothetical protein